MVGRVDRGKNIFVYCAVAEGAWPVDDFFEKFRSLHAEMELLLDDFFRIRHPFALSAEKRWRPCVDIYETEDDVVLIAELAGVSREDISVSASEVELYLSGTRREPATHSKKYYHSMEIRTGPFEKLTRLPRRVDPDRIAITLENGLLKIRLPKVKRPKEVIVEIE